MDRRITVFIHVAVLLALLVLVINLKTILILVTGSKVPIAVVNGRSMFPTLREGDIVFSYRPKPQEIKVNDIIIFRKSDGTYVIHRVIDVRVVTINAETKYYYETKGDNNPSKDPGLLTYEDVEGVVVTVGGRVFRIPYLGYLSIWFNHLRRTLG